MTFISNNLESLSKEIKAISDSDVNLVVVTKKSTVEETQEVIDYGIEDIAENKVQDLLYKMDNLSGNYRMHMIGHLQTNKVNKLVGKVYLIQSVDSLKLAEKINNRAGVLEIKQNVLLQFNISGEEQKYGFDPRNVKDIVETIGKLDNLVIKGIMLMAPNNEKESNLRRIFARGKEIFDYLSNFNYNNLSMTILSMGMTRDYKVAISEGSNMVRIGRLVFKEED